MDKIEDGLELPAANSRFYELIKKTPYKKGVGFDVTNLTDDEKSEFKELKESSGFLNDDDVFVSLQQLPTATVRAYNTKTTKDNLLAASKTLKDKSIWTAKTVTPIGAAENIYNDPLGYLKSTGQFISDVITLNPAPNPDDWMKMLDVAEVAPFVSLGAKSAKMGSKLPNISNFIKTKSYNNKIKNQAFFIPNQYDNKVIDNFDIHDVRLKYHNNIMMSNNEMKLLKQKGKGKKENYEQITPDDILGSSHTKDKELDLSNTNPRKVMDVIRGKEQKTLKSKKDTKIKIENISDAQDFNIKNNQNIKFTNTSTTYLKNPFLDNEAYNKFKNRALYKPYDRTKDTRAADKWLEEWYTNPNILERWKNYGGDEKYFKDVVLNSLENPIRGKYVYGKNQPAGVYMPMIDQASIDINPKIIDKFGTGVHEGGHKTKIVLPEGTILKDSKKFENPLPELYNDLVDAVRLEPWESYAEIKRMRAKMGWTPEDKLKISDLEKGLKTISDGYMLPLKIKENKKSKFLDIVNKAPVLLPILGAAATGATSQQQYRNGGLVGDPPEKKSKLVDFTDITWTDKDLEYANENLLCFDGQCLDRSLQAYDKVVASYLPGMPSSSKFKKDYGFQSAPKYEKYEDTWTDKIVEKAGYEGDPSTGKISYVSVGGAKKPVSDKTQKWFESQRGFDVKNSDFTVDSWDYSGVLKDEGGQVIFTESNKDFFSNKSEKEKSDIYKKLPIGTHIGYGSREGRADIQYNKEKGLSSSSHSAIVVGYNEDGLPIIYDYDQYKPINTKGIYGEDQITNIVIPKHSIGKDREYFAKQNLLLKESAPLDLDLTELYKQGDKNELNVFYRTLVANKENLMNDLKIDSKTYDDYAKNLLAISMQETGGGTSIEHNIFGDTFGSTHGLTQLNRKNILDDEQLKNIADKYGINENTNLSDPRRHAIASMIYHKRHQIAADKAYEQGLNPSIRTYRQVGNDFFKDVARSMQSKSHAYKNNVFRTDEGTEIDMFSGINYLGLGSQKSIEKIQSELDAVKKDKYRAYKKDGEILIDKKTLGNYKLDKKGNKIKMSPSDRAIYAWSGFKTLKYGDAQGDNAYYKNVKKYRDLIKDRNVTAKRK